MGTSLFWELTCDSLDRLVSYPGKVKNITTRLTPQKFSAGIYYHYYYCHQITVAYRRV